MWNAANESYAEGIVYCEMPIFVFVPCVRNRRLQSEWHRVIVSTHRMLCNIYISTWASRFTYLEQFMYCSENCGCGSSPLNKIAMQTDTPRCYVSETNV